jgi:hypothetical protein
MVIGRCRAREDRDLPRNESDQRGVDQTGKAGPDISRSDQFRLGLTLHATVKDPAFVRFVEMVGKESTDFFNTQDWLEFFQAGRGEEIAKELQSRLARLLDLCLNQTDCQQGICNARVVLPCATLTRQGSGCRTIND